MTKKVIISIFCIFLLLTCVLPVLAHSEVVILDDSLKIFDKIDNSVNENTTLKKYAIATIGPVFKKYSQVKILDGAFLKVKRIERNLNRRLVRASAILPFFLINVEKISFTLYYKKDLNNNSRFSYATLFGEAVYDEQGNYVDTTNETFIHNRINKILVENFTGYFIFFRIRAFRLVPFLNMTRFFTPAQFIFTGFADNVVEVPI